MTPRALIALSCRSGWAPPLATLTMMSRARGEFDWLRTKSARSLSLGELVPASICSMIGSARSGSLCVSPRSAINFSSSSPWLSGDTVCPAAWRTSVSSARASRTQRLFLSCCCSSLTADSASACRPSLARLYAFQYSAASVRFVFSASTALKRSSARSYLPSSMASRPSRNKSSARSFASARAMPDAIGSHASADTKLRVWAASAAAATARSTSRLTSGMATGWAAAGPGAATPAAMRQKQTMNDLVTMVVESSARFPC